MRSLNKSKQLNYTIKRMVKLALKETATELGRCYYVANGTLYTLDTDTVVNNTLIITPGKGTVEGDRLTLQ